MPKKSLCERFFDNVHPEPNTGCWLWGGYVIRRGYGRLGDGTKRLRLATHVSLEIAGTPVPPGMCACHRCDNPWCVNPDHLFVATQRENVRDMHAKQRWRRPRVRRGAELAQTKLTEADVRGIRASLAAGERQQALASRFGVARTTISTIATGRAWAHVSEEPLT